ncbi:Uncharacterised protein [Enterobacter cloacae]|nr:Uncharacterised protein [Enterobacter cloacae]
MQGVSDVLCCFDQLFLFHIPEHFRRCFRFRRQHKVIGETVNDLFLLLFGNRVSGRDERDRSG